MVALLLPILAQTLTATATDRAEVAARINRSDTTFEASNATSGMARLDYSRKRLQLGLDYVPSFVVVASPLDDPELSLLWTQSVGASFGIRGRHSDFGVRAQASYGERDFRRELLLGAAPLSPDDPGLGTPTEPTEPVDPGTAEPAPIEGADARAVPGKSRFGSVRGEAYFQQRFSRTASASLVAGYGVSKSFGDSSGAYPTTRSADATLSVSQSVSRRDTLSSVLSARTSSSARGSATETVTTPGGRAWVVGLSESLSHRFGARSSGTVNAGASYTREKRRGEEADWSVYPIAGVTYSYSRASRSGILSLTLSNTFNAVIDPVSSSIDPRASFSTTLTWSDRRNYSLSAAVDTTRSLEPQGTGALQTVSGSGIASWFLGAGFSAQAGVRTAFQSYQQSEQLPPTWDGFVALAFGLDLTSGLLALRPPYSTR